MPDEKVIAIAAALIVSRKATLVQEVMQALLDAENILNPKPASPTYKAWQTGVGLTPTTVEEDQKAEASKSRTYREAAAKVAR